MEMEGKTMPRTIAFLVLSLSLAACSGLERFDGLAAVAGREGVFASSGAPALIVIPADGFRSVAGGSLFANAARNGADMAYSPVRVSYALFAAGPRQLVAYLADAASGWEWPPNPGFTERRGLPARDAGLVTRDGFEMESVTYVRPRDWDPWAAAYAAPGSGRGGDVLVRQYTWRTMADSVKLVVEYREAVPVGENVPPERFPDFAERADASFRLGGKEQAASAAWSRENPTPVDVRLLAAVLGEIRRKPSIWDLD
jgi:hypothetical protein